MKTSKTVRSYKYLIITIINFIALFIAKIYYEYINNLEYKGEVDDENWKNFLDFSKSQEDILANVLMVSVILSLIIIIKKIKNFNSGIEKLILGVWFIYTISIIVGLIDRQMYGEYAYIICKTYFINYLLFIPHLFLIYKYLFIGETIDLSKDIRHNEEKKYSNNLDDLKKLLNLGHISKEEFNLKKELILKKKIETELVLSDEYKLLKKTKETGLITEEEFKLKLNNLLDKKYSESL